MRKRNRITLEDIAKRLGVSRVTVSKVLRGHTDISTETSQRVKKVVAEMGYTPNIFARSLSARKSNMIGLIVPKIAHYFFSAVIEAVYDAAFERNYETILTVSQENPEREWKHLQALASMRVDGIIISVTQRTDDVERFKWIRKLGIPLVFVDRKPEKPISGFGSVVTDDHNGAYQAVEHAIKIGYRKLGLIGGNKKINIGKNRIIGFEDAVKEFHLPLNKKWIITGGYGKDDGYNGFKQLYQNGSIPEFILAITYPVALGILEAAKELDVKIPDDVDLICFGDSDVGRFISPAMSAVRQPTRELGMRAVEILFEDIEEKQIIKEHHVILPAQLVIRETCTVKKAKGLELAESETIQKEESKLN